MKVLLINTTRLFRYTFPPYGLALINAFLNKNSINSDIFDLDVIVKHHNSLGEESLSIDIDYLRKNYRKMYQTLRFKQFDNYLEMQLDKMLDKVRLKGADVVGFSSHDNEIYLSFYLAKKVKERNGCITIIGGSPFLRFDINRLNYLIEELGVNYVDYIVKGNAYDFFLKLSEGKINAKADGTPFLFTDTDINPTSYTHDYEFPLYNEEHLELYKIKPSKMGFYYNRLSDELLDKLKVLEDMKEVKPVLILPYKFTAGCSNNCAFCYIRKEAFKLDEDAVLSGIKDMKKKYGCDNFYFLNNNILMDKEYARNIFRRLSNEVDIRWSDSVSIKGLDNKTVRLMADSGCIGLLFGLESASQRMLCYMNKNSGCNKLEYYTKCFKICDRNGVWVIVNLVGGLPYEREKDLTETIAYVEKNKEVINGVYANRFVMTDTTSFFKDYSSYGIQIVDDGIVRKTIKSKLGENADVYAEVYYRHFPFNEINGLCWEDKQKQINRSILALRDYISDKCKTKCYVHYPIFLLYNAFNGNKKEIVQFLLNKH